MDLSPVSKRALTGLYRATCGSNTNPFFTCFITFIIYYYDLNTTHNNGKGFD